MRILLAAILAAFFVSSASAQQACFKREALLKHLASKFGERPVVAGVVVNGSILEVFASQNGQTWTIAITTPAGATCIKASGENWERRDFPKKGSDA